MTIIETWGILSEWSVFAQLFLITFVSLFLGFFTARIQVWTLAYAVMFWLIGVPNLLWWIFVPLAIMNVPPLRAMIISKLVMEFLKAKKLLPAISETERIALEAGATWIDGELFSGKPNFKKIIAEPYEKLSKEEQAFLDGPCEKLCNMVTDWDIYLNKDLPQEVWNFIKREKFFGMIVPKAYGGLEFSAIANSEVVHKLSSRSIPLAVTVMVPNSLGPAELISHYGTEQQKKYYLPRLASGEEVPCFALTEPTAGSDAGSIKSEGVVFRGHDGKLYVRLNWNKRYITLAAVSTIIGLAIRLKDPENLLGKGEDVGITCMLIPANTKGVVLGKRHNSMGVPFFNCPTVGKDVVVSINQIIGGPEGAGQGWRMLMECLSAGRSISLPAQSTGGAKLASRVVSAYTLIRQQFGISIGQFEGIEECLARMFGFTYLLEASRVFTCAAVDSGIKPAVISAIAKYNSTELGRKITIDGMDILGGAGVSRGPRNNLANQYIASPIGITVEGANILTRTMIIFGQGAIRCHPFAYKEMQAVQQNNLFAFDKAFWGHVGHVVTNTCRAILLNLTRGHLAFVPSGKTSRYYQKLSWTSATFALIADLAMGIFGGKLKFKEKLTGRFADILSWMYLATATLRRFEAEGRQKEHEPFLHWSMHYAFAKIQEAFEGILENFDVPLMSWLFKKPLALWIRINRLSGMPSDQLGNKVVKAMLHSTEVREALTGGIYISHDKDDVLGRYEHALKLIKQAENVYKQIQKGLKHKIISKKKGVNIVEEALKADLIAKQEAELVRKAEEARNDAIQVDAFPLLEYRSALIEDEAAVANG